jgi:hypothetical protein
MKQNYNLGKLERVNLRQLWESEAQDFTPWLAKEENLALLSETLDLELELEKVEQNVGSFKADILCKDAYTNSMVLIENQLEKTDHTHLGQLLTYASGLNSVVIIWIAEHFREEHRAALDWLNEKTDENISFFGLEVELWRIGNSPIAPKFNVVCKPNDWSRTISNSASSGERNVSDLKLMQMEYWQGFKDRLIETKSPLRGQKPQPQHWYDFAVGRSNCWLSLAANSQKNFLRVRLVLAGSLAKERFSNLLSKKEEIEQELGFKLQWEEKPENPQSLITLDKQNVNPTDRSDWQNQYEYFQNTLEKFYKVFSRYLKEVD